MAGYFQLGHIYLKYKPQILNYIHDHKDNHSIQTDLQEKYLMRELVDDIVLPRDKQYAIVIHIRLSDFNGRLDYIEIEHYLNLFATLNFKDQTVCIVHENSQRPADRAYIATCLAWFQERQIPIRLETNSVLVDFNIMKQAKTLICSMSTLAWTAAYLSTTLQVCYMPNYNFSQDKNKDKANNRRHFFFHKPIENTILYSVKSTPAVLARIKPFIVTLPEYSDRLTKLGDFNQQLSLIGLDAVIYNGVHGKDIRIYNAASIETKIKHITWQNTTYFYDTRVRLNGAPMTRGEFGCAWSHLNLLRQLIKESSSDDEYYLILEDDVELVKSVDELYQLLNHIPQDADMCHLAASTFFPFKHTNQINAYFYECEKKYFNKTTAYIVSAKGAKKIIDYTKNSINVPIDDLFNMIYRLTPDFKYYVPESFYFKERDDTVSALIDINNRYL
jgi:GR25 family glycosyltransferase involved in LPS biosynthesis